MSTIKSSDEHLTLNADGSSKDIKFQANGVEKASISSAGAFTSTTIDATKLTGTIPNFTSTGIDDNADATAITINSSEQVGIGQTSPSAQLHLKQTSGDQFLKMEGATTNWGWRNQSDGTHGLYDFTNSRWLYLGNNSYWSVQTGGSEKFKIMSDGRGLSQFTAMAWANVGLDNVAAGNSSPGGSLNVSSVTLNSTGNAVFNFTNNISSASVASLVNNNTAGGTAIVNGTSTSGVDVTTYHSNGNATNASLCNITTHGGS